MTSPFKRQRMFAGRSSCRMTGNGNGECTLHYTAPRCLSTNAALVSNSDFFNKIAVKTPTVSATPSLSSSSSAASTGVTTDGESCLICQLPLTSNQSVTGKDEPCVEIDVCKHVFHEKCIRDVVLVPQSHQPKCPGCHLNINCRPRGTCPSGTMTICLRDVPCPGFSPKTKTYELEYCIPSGKQQTYHENPGYRYHGFSARVAYLPNDVKGQRVLTRFIYAFEHGHMFTVSTSIATGRSNTVVWSPSLPQKSSLHGGPFGFPDPNYIPTVDYALDCLGVPSADGLPSLNIGNGPFVVHRTAPVDLGPHKPLNGVLVPVANTASRNASSTTALTAAAPPAPTDQIVVELDADDDCIICFETLSSGDAVQIKACSHNFHEACIARCLQHESKCPTCRTLISEDLLQGKSPSGTMSVSKINRPCPGFGPCGTYEISYSIPSGIQHSFHESPGQHFGGASRTAYLPDTAEGKQLLARLKYAFAHGLTFRVGTSITSGAPNVVTWASIHHKTSLHGGSHGFPDPLYISNCNESLDALKVPDANICLQRYP